jgi:hypothetical protein
MMRTEMYCGGRIVKQIDQVDVSISYVGQQYTDGPWRWYLDGREITEQQAESYISTWPSRPSSI